MSNLKLKVTRPKPSFSNFYLYDADLDADLQLEKLNQAREAWLNACEEWRLINRPALLKVLSEPLPPDENTPLSSSGDTPSGGGGEGYTMLVLKTLLAYIGILIGYQLFKVFL